MFSPILLVTFLGLAGRVLAQAQNLPMFNITVATVNNLPVIANTSQILNIPSSPVLAPCAANLADTQTKVSACGQDPNCLCNADTVTALFDMETCMFHTLIAANKPAPVPFAGSNPVMTGYAAACKAANITIPANQSALVLPDSWDGPFVAVLPFGGMVVTVAVGGVLGISALLLLSNIE